METHAWPLQNMLGPVGIALQGHLGSQPTGIYSSTNRRFSRSKIDSRLNGFRLRLGHLQVDDDVTDKHCKALDSPV